MTLQELKDKKIVFSNIKDNDLIRIFNEVLNVKPEIKTMNHNVDNNAINRVIYSKTYIDWYIEKLMSNRMFSKTYKCEELLKNLRIFIGRASKLSGFGKEVAYINECVMKYEKVKALSEKMDNSLENNIESLINLDPNNVSKLNKEALSVMMISLLGQIQELKKNVEELVEQNNSLMAQKAETVEEKKVEEKIKEVVHNDINNGVMEQLNVQEVKTKIEPVNGPVNSGEMESLFPKNSIRYLRNHFVIPSELKEDEIIAYCNDVLKFSPKLVDNKSVLTFEQVVMLNQSNLVASARVKSDISKSHKDVMSGYSGLIANYEKMLENMPEGKEFDGERKKIIESLSALRDQEASYKKTVSGFNNQSMEQYFGFGVSNNDMVSRNVSHLSSLVTENQQNKLTELDREIAMLTKEKQNLESFDMKFGFGKIKKEFDTRVLSTRIEHLKKKQGRIKGRQTQIVKANTMLYKSKMEKEFQKYKSKQYSMERSLDKKASQLEKEKIKEQRLKNLRLKIKNAEAKKSINNIERAELNVAKAREKQLAESLERLKSKSGKVNIVEQYSSTFDNQVSYAM